MQYSALDLILNAGAVVKVVLFVLLTFSVISWAIIIYKYRYLSNAQRQTDVFIKSYEKSGDLTGAINSSKRYPLSPISNVMKAALHEPESKDKERIKRSLHRFETLEAEKLEQYLSFLATTGSTTPFIGLFGTVWGIMNSFRGIGETGAASLAVVAPGIAEALIATAMGLAAAIPAVIAYNYYMSRTRQLIVQMTDFSEEIIDLLSSAPHED